MKLTNNEQNYIMTLSAKMEKLQNYLISNNEDDKLSISQWYSYISHFKRILGNFDNDVSFIACLLAKEFLITYHQISPNFDVADKPQGAPGLDIEIETLDGKRIIAEIKTTIPYKSNELGAQQKKMFEKDFHKLNEKTADHKYFFVTEEETFRIMKDKYLEELRGVSVVLLPAALNDSQFIIKVPLDFRYLKRTNSIEIIKVRNTSNSKGNLADLIRKFIYEKYILEAKSYGLTTIEIRSGDVRKAMGLNGRYAAVCSAMGGKKIEEYYNVHIIDRRGKEGAEFFVTYELNK